MTHVLVLWIVPKLENDHDLIFWPYPLSATSDPTSSTVRGDVFSPSILEKPNYLKFISQYLCTFYIEYCHLVPSIYPWQTRISFGVINGKKNIQQLVSMVKDENFFLSSVFLKQNIFIYNWCIYAYTKNMVANGNT